MMRATGLLLIGQHDLADRAKLPGNCQPLSDFIFSDLDVAPVHCAMSIGTLL